MSDPSEASDAEPPREADEDDYPDVDAESADPADRTTDRQTSAEAEAEAEEDAEEVASEWHLWILAAVVVLGVVLFFAPSFFLPELVGSLGLLLVVIGVVGWAVKWAIERTA